MHNYADKIVEPAHIWHTVTYSGGGGGTRLCGGSVFDLLMNEY